MAEVAGLVLGAIPLAIWALEKYAEPFETFQKYRISIDTLRADLILQRRQLEITLSGVGLENPTAVELRECFESKFPSVHKELIIIIERMDKSTGQLIKDLDIDLNGKPQWTYDSPDRAQWEWRRVKRCFSSSKKKTLINDLRQWNEDLRNCIERPEVAPEDDMPQVQRLIKKFNRSHCNSIRSCLRSFHRALGAALSCDCPSSHHATIDLDWNLSQSTIPWIFTAGLSYETCENSSSKSWRKFRVTAEQDAVAKLEAPVPTTPPLVPLSKQFFSRKEKSPVSFLFDSFRRPHQPTSPSPPPLKTPTQSTASIKTIDNLCIEVRTNCTSWSINGCLQDPDTDKDQQFDRFSLDKTSEQLSDRSTTISLRRLLLIQNKRNSSGDTALSTKQRYAIAASIAWSVLHMSDSPWLDEKWNQDEISFFVEESGKDQKLLSQHPCTSYAFQGQEPVPEQPSSDSRDFDDMIPNKTVFTLGVILIELCLKTTLEELRKSMEGQEEAPSSINLLEKYRTALKALDEVYREAGDAYGNAVQRCVRSSFDGSEATKKFNVEQFRIQFYNTVVAPVQATYLMMPGTGSYC